jgi:glycosyltransferase involved in cell wall biosynthesis
MIIGIDARSAIGKRAGIGNYFLNLIRNISLNDNANNIILYVDREPDFDIANQNIEIRVFRYPILLWHFRVMIDIRLSKIDCYYTSSNIIPLMLPLNKSILFIADMTGILFGNYHTVKVRLLTQFSRIAAKKARMIITISESSKNDIVKLLKVAPTRVKVTYLASSDDFYVISDNYYLKNVKIRYRLPGKFILFVGSIEPRKNFDGLIDAYNKIRRSIEQKLVIVGGRGWKNSAIYKRIKEKGMQDDVLFVGYVPDSDLVAVYNLADLFIYPSFYEGFGIPLLEAMSCGVPIVASHSSSIPEVVGEAGLLCDPYDSADIAKKIESVIMSPKVSRDLIHKGFLQQRRFSWRITCDLTVKAFNEAGKYIL